jgi:hypothetical protein
VRCRLQFRHTPARGNGDGDIGRFRTLLEALRSVEKPGCNAKFSPRTRNDRPRPVRDDGLGDCPCVFQYFLAPEGISGLAISQTRPAPTPRFLVDAPAEQCRHYTNNPLRGTGFAGDV